MSPSDAEAVVEALERFVVAIVREEGSDQVEDVVEKYNTRDYLVKMLEAS